MGGEKSLFGKFEGGERVWAGDGGKLVQKGVEGVAGRQAIEQILKGNASAGENGNAGELFRVAFNDGVNGQGAIPPLRKMTAGSL
jgi:hypothetical protein